MRLKLQELTILKSDPMIVDFPNSIMEAILSNEEKFYEELAEKLLGRKIDPKQDSNKFTRNIYNQHNPPIETLSFNGVEVGEIKRDYIGMDGKVTIEFIPFERHQRNVGNYNPKRNKKIGFKTGSHGAK